MRHSLSTFAALLLTVLPSATAMAQTMATGSYTGNATDNRVISGLGFQPDVVLVKSDAGHLAVLRSSTMTGDSSKRIAQSSALVTNRIQSFNSDGFVIGSDIEVNRNGNTYYWVAFKAQVGELAVSSYTGNAVANRNITGLGFAPDCVFVMGAASHRGLIRSSSMPAGSSGTFNGNGMLTNRIQSLLADGFQIGNDAEVNTNGQIYHYVAFKAVTGRMNYGLYTGNGADNRNITGAGFQPGWVVLINNGSAASAHRPESVMGDLSLHFRATGEQNNRIQALQSNGFQVGTNTMVNQNGTIYYWVAFKSGSSGPQGIRIVEWKEIP